MILQDRSWPFHQWNPQTKALVQSPRPAISMGKMLENVTELQEMACQQSQIARFSALRAAGDSPVVPWRLQICPRADDFHQLLVSLCNSSAWSTLGTNLKIHSQNQSTLATDLQAQLGQRPTKGRGKGKMTGKAKQETP